MAGILCGSNTDLTGRRRCSTLSGNGPRMKKPRQGDGALPLPAGYNQGMEASHTPIRFSLGAIFLAIAVISVALAITISNWAEYQREYQREDGHLFDLLAVFQRYCLVWLTACVASICVALRAKWELRTLAIGFAAYASMACLINFLQQLVF